MVSGIDDHAGDGQASGPPGTIHDRRVKPRGVLPRHVQMWLMVGIAVVILVIILLTGHPEPLPRLPQSGTRSAQPSLVPPERVKSYEQALAAEADRQQSAREPVAVPRPPTPVTASAAPTVDPLSDELRRREYQSLFADNVALSRRAANRQANGEPRQAERTGSPSPPPASLQLPMLQELLNLGRVPPSPRPSPAPPMPAIPPAGADSLGASVASPPEIDTPLASKETGPTPVGGLIQRLFEGTVIETVLLNRLDGTFAGPVACLVTTPVYSHDRQSVVIPAGARVLGTASPVQTWGASRLAVSFHRLVMPDGRTYTLDHFKGLGQVGDAGLTDRINRHYVQVFGASLAIGALSGLAQYGSRNQADVSGFADVYRQAAGSSLAASTGRVLDRYLNVLPTITIREGYRIKVYLTNDLQLPSYATFPGGAR